MQREWIMPNVCRVRWCVAVPAQGAEYCAIHLTSPVLREGETLDEARKKLRAEQIDAELKARHEALEEERRVLRLKRKGPIPTGW